MRGIGIAVHGGAQIENGFLPGLEIRDGAIWMDEARLQWPGDILHEAGHLAVTEPELRGAPALSPTPADEMAALAWSYAAAVHLGIPLDVLFHPGGYRGGSEALIEGFTQGRILGMPLLAWFGLCIDPLRAEEGGPPPFPHMLRWLR